MSKQRNLYSSEEIEILFNNIKHGGECFYDCYPGNVGLVCPLKDNCKLDGRLLFLSSDLKKQIALEMLLKAGFTEKDIFDNLL